jgi:hypothetical protein
VIERQRRDCGVDATTTTTARHPLTLLQTSIVPYESKSQARRDVKKTIRIEGVWLNCSQTTTISLLPHPGYRRSLLGSPLSRFRKQQVQCPTFYHSTPPAVLFEMLSRHCSNLELYIVSHPGRCAFHKSRSLCGRWPRQTSSAMRRQLRHQEHLESQHDARIQQRSAPSS